MTQLKDTDSKPSWQELAQKVREHQRAGSNGQEKNSVGIGDALNDSLKRLATTGEASAEQKALSPIGKPLGEIGAAVHPSAPIAVREVADILSKLPSPIQSWLNSIRRDGWQAKTPDYSPELVAQTREIAGQIWRKWKPVDEGKAEDKAALINEVMQTLSVYGYGALPSDPAQSKAKVSGFCGVLSDLPLWAIQEAGKEWRTNQTEPPTPADWRREAKERCGYNQWLTPLPGGINDGYTMGWAYDKVVEWLKNGK